MSMDKGVPPLNGERKKYEDIVTSPNATPWKLYVAAMIINLPQLGVGITLGWTSPTIPKLMEKDSHIVITLEQGAKLGTWMMIGAILGPILVGLLVDKLGRRGSLQLAVTLSLVSWLLLGLANSVQFLYAARFISGLAVSMELSLSPLYIAEISQPDKRGALTSLIQCMSNTGYLIVYGVGPFVSYNSLLILSSAPMVLFLLLSLTLKESPYYLVANNDFELARNSLEAYRQGIDVEHEMSVIQKSVDGKIGYKESLALLVQTPIHRKALLISSALFFFFEFSGMIIVTAYTQPILAESGSSLSPSYSSVLVSIVKVIAGLVTPLVTSFYGCRNLFILSCCVITVEQGALGVFFYLHHLNYSLENFSWLPVISIAVYTSFLSIGLASLPLAIMSEIFAPQVKASGAMISSVFNCSLAYILMLLFDYFINNWYICFWMYSGITALAIPFVLFFVPDTRKMTLEDIQEWLN